MKTSFSKPILALSILLAGISLSCGGPLLTAKDDLLKNVVFRWNPAAYTGTDYAQYVDPMIGTAAHGHTFPGATAPFGMVQLSPDTRVDGSWDGCSGYHYSDSLIYGFSHTHLSGTGCSDYGDILLMPGTGEALFNNGADGKPGYRSAFSHKNEEAEAGYYKVKLQNGVTAELTASPRSGLHRYTFPENEGHVVIDLKHRDEVIESQLHFGEFSVSGYRVSKAWATEQRIYFYAEFSERFDSVLIRDTTAIVSQEAYAKNETVSKDLRAILQFRNLKNPLVVKVGISAVSELAAEVNMHTETGSRSFDEVRKAVRDDWNKELACIAVKSENKKQLRTFYTALYHCFTAPNVYCDVDGSYRGRDQKVHKDSLHPQYTVFSLWDTHRALHPLFTLVQQQRTNDFIRTFLKQYKEGGRLPVWELSGNETDCMIGYHAVPVITDAYVKGIRDYDAKLAMEAMLHSATEDRRGLKAYKQCGYIPAEGEPESVSKTLEYAYDDWCIAQMAQLDFNNATIYDEYIARSQAWKNLYDPQSGFMRARLNNAFVEPFSPEEVNFHYTEANAWQYSMALPHDISSLIARMGGPEKFEKHLDNLFTTSSKTSGREQADITGLIGQYAHGNEPSHHMAYLYAYCGKPEKAEYRVHEVLNTLYTDQPDGLCGNEDCGQMSAWYVLSALGFYPVTPGTPDYVCGMPLFESVTVNLENGKTLEITTPKLNVPYPYVYSIMLNEKAAAYGTLNHNELMKGGKLIYNVESRLNESKISGGLPRYFKTPGMDIEYAQYITPVPRSLTSNRVFEKNMQLAFAEPERYDHIYYSLNNGPFTEWKNPVTLSETTTIKAFAKIGDKKSHTAEFTYFKAPNDRTIKLFTKYANQYAAGGDKALIDFIRGPDNFMTGMWQGYEGVNVEAVVDLSKTQSVTKCSIGFLQDENAWIFMPDEVEYLVSDDGVNFKSIGIVKNTIPDKQTGVIRKDFTLQQSTRARYIKVIGKNKGVCPPWHKGAGNKSWIFADEIVIE